MKFMIGRDNGVEIIWYLLNLFINPLIKIIVFFLVFNVLSNQNSDCDNLEYDLCLSLLLILISEFISTPKSKIKLNITYLALDIHVGLTKWIEMIKKEIQYIRKKILRQKSMQTSLFSKNNAMNKNTIENSVFKNNVTHKSCKVLIWDTSLKN